MAGQAATVHFNLTADSANAVKNITAVEKAATKTSNATEKAFAGSNAKLQNHFSGISKTIQDFTQASGAGFAGLAAAGGVAFIGIAKSAIDAASAFDTAHARLEAAVANTGQSFQQYAGTITGADDKLRGFGFTSTETEAALVPLVNATHSVKKALDLMGLAADIARGKNISLGDATALLAKVEQGRYRALNDLLSKQQVKGITSTTQAIQVLSNVYSGQAAAAAGTFSGKLKVVSANLDELKVTLGNTIMPLISDYTGVLGKAAGAFNDFATKHKSFMGGFTRGLEDVLSLGITEMLRAGGAFKSAADPAKNAVDSLKSAQHAYTEDLAKGNVPFAQRIADLVNYQASAGKVKTIQDGLTSATNLGSDADKKAADALKAHNDSLKNLYDTENSVLDSSLSLDEQNHKLIDTFKKFEDAQKLMIASGGKNNDVNEAAVQANYDLQHGIIAAGEAAKKAAEDQQRLSNAQRHVATDTGVATAGHQAEIKELQTLALTFPPLAGQIQDYINKLGGIPAAKHTQVTVDFNTVNIPLLGINFGQLGRAHASGGPVTAGVSYPVGERGPEMFTPSTNGFITPNRGAGVTINVAVSGSNARQLVNDIVVELNSGGARDLQRALGVV